MVLIKPLISSSTTSINLKSTGACGGAGRSASNGSLARRFMVRSQSNELSIATRREIVRRCDEDNCGEQPVERVKNNDKQPVERIESNHQQLVERVE